MRLFEEVDLNGESCPWKNYILKVKKPQPKTKVKLKRQYLTLNIGYNIDEHRFACCWSFTRLQLVPDHEQIEETIRNLAERVAV